jgi:hypothetical protein
MSVMQSPPNRAIQRTGSARHGCDQIRRPYRQPLRRAHAFTACLVAGIRHESQRKPQTRLSCQDVMHVSPEQQRRGISATLV